jgi:hypothetical protein
MHPGPSPVESIERIIRYWWIIVACMIMGGIAGWMISFSLPRVYQAQAEIGVYIDFTLTGALTDVEEDMAIVAIGDVIKSSDVIFLVAEQAKAGGIEMNSKAFWENAFLEREGDRWKLIVRDSDANKATKLAEIWANVSLKSLQEAYEHAFNAEKMQRYQDSLVSCLGQIVVTNPVYAFCELDSLEKIQTELQQTGVQLSAEKLAGKGILSASNFDLVQKAEVPGEAVLYGKGSLVLAGTIIGLIIALVSLPSLELFFQKRIRV